MHTALHPRVDVEIAFETARQPLKPLLAGALDVALLSEGYVGRGLAITRLFTDEFVAVVAPGHPWAGRAYVTPEDFASVRLLLLVPPRDSTVMRHFLEPAGVRPRQIVDVQLIGALSSLVVAQSGVGVLASWTIAPELRDRRPVAAAGKGGIEATLGGRRATTPLQGSVGAGLRSPRGHERSCLGTGGRASLARLTLHPRPA